MTTNGPLTTAEAKEVLDCTHTQLYRWRDAGKLTGKLRRGRVTRWEWDPEPVERLRQAREMEARRRAQRDAEILARWDGATPYRQFAAEMGIPNNTVWNVIRKSGRLRRISS